uniref:60S ribosomal protein L27 n=1 Tax=Leptobrachium leishanense TaxID=445787 RepID=A0A8C5M0H0_9ANUR
MKPGKVVLVLARRYAGRKAIIVKYIDDGTPDSQYSHILVTGIDRYSRKVTATMAKKRIAKRSKIAVVNKDIFRDPALKRKVRRESAKTHCSIDSVARKPINKSISEKWILS